MDLEEGIVLNLPHKIGCIRLLHHFRCHQNRCEHNLANYRQQCLFGHNLDVHLIQPVDPFAFLLVDYGAFQTSHIHLRHFYRFHCLLVHVQSPLFGFTTFKT